MTPDAFRHSLALLGFSQAAFRREVEALGGERLPARTVENWARGSRSIPATVPALLRVLLERSGDKFDPLGVPPRHGASVRTDQASDG